MEIFRSLPYFYSLVIVLHTHTHTHTHSVYISLPYAAAWMNLEEDIMLSEISQSRKDKYCMIPLNKEGLKIVQLIETVSTMVVPSI